MKPTHTSSPHAGHRRGAAFRPRLRPSILAGALFSLCLFASSAVIEAQPSPAAPTRVDSREALQDAVQNAGPGAVIVIADGTWKDEEIVLRGKGKAGAPITVRAETGGGVKLTGESSLEVQGEHIAVEGLQFSDGWLDSGTIVMLDGSNLVLRQTVIDSYNNPDREVRYFWVGMRGTHNTVEECTFRGMNHSGVTVVVRRDDAVPDFHTIRRNYFVDRPRGTGNGWETVRIGTSHQSLSNSNTVVEENLFENCNGEAEIISSKSGGNIYRRNTFRACKGSLTLRHGNDCIVDSNYFLGENVDDTGGIRVIGEGNRIVNNYIEGTQGRGGAAIAVNAGPPNPRLASYAPAHQALVAFNTIVGVKGPHIDVSTSLGSSRTVVPENVVVANNLMVAGDETEGELVEGQPGPGFKAEGNIGHGREPGSLPREGIRIADPQMSRGKNGIWRPASGSPAVQGAAGSYPEIDYDIGGRPRGAEKTVGCEEVSDAAPFYPPLQPKDVGASWAR